MFFTELPVLLVLIFQLILLLAGAVWNTFSCLGYLAEVHCGMQHCYAHGNFKSLLTSPWRREIQPGELLLLEMLTAWYSQASSELPCWWGGKEERSKWMFLALCSKWTRWWGWKSLIAKRRHIPQDLLYIYSQTENVNHSHVIVLWYK